MQKQPEPLMQFNATFIPHTQHGTGDHLKPTHNARILSSNKKAQKPQAEQPYQMLQGFVCKLPKINCL